MINLINPSFINLLNTNDESPTFPSRFNQFLDIDGKGIVIKLMVIKYHGNNEYRW